VILDHESELRATCHPGLAGYLSAEIEALGLPVGRMTRTGVLTRGRWPDVWRLCLELRTANTVLRPLKSFSCDSPKTLYHHVRSIPWEEVIPDEDGYLTVESTVDHPSVDNSMFPNLRVKDAICDHLIKVRGRRPDSGSDRRGVVVHLHWSGPRATISLKAGGRKLADRGYRKMAHRAPLREPLAAAIVMESSWDGRRPLLVPMCGSGTLAIEAALIALDRAPGLLRLGFGFERTVGLDQEAWKEMRAEVRRRSRKSLDAPIIATDIDPDAVEAARRNALTAGVEHLIEFAVGDFAETRIPEPADDEGPAGVLLVNPEYGERLGDERALEPVYERLGTWFRESLPGWNCHLLSGNPRLTKHLGLRSSRRVPFLNATVECRLLEYEIRARRGD
jgi:putative N6-adenine-specific DNA methylase